jgi:AraC-like DNA-binding protein
VRARLGDADLSLDTLARLCHKSPRAVQQQFANAGTSFSEFLAEARLERARDLLANPLERRLVLEIALECGFTNFPAFSRAFRRRFGMTPTDARELLTHR